MALTLTYPIDIEGKVYPYYALKSISITGLTVNNNKDWDAHVAITVVPYRVLSNNDIEELSEQTISKSFAYVFSLIDNGDTAMFEASQHIFAGIDTIVKQYELWL